jgi:hypothetical protein
MDCTKVKRHTTMAKKYRGFVSELKVQSFD